MSERESLLKILTRERPPNEDPGNTRENKERETADREEGKQSLCPCLDARVTRVKPVFLSLSLSVCLSCVRGASGGGARVCIPSAHQMRVPLPSFSRCIRLRIVDAVAAVEPAVPHPSHPLLLFLVCLDTADPAASGCRSS